MSNIPPVVKKIRNRAKTFYSFSGLQPHEYKKCQELQMEFDFMREAEAKYREEVWARAAKDFHGQNVLTERGVAAATALKEEQEKKVNKKG